MPARKTRGAQTMDELLADLPSAPTGKLQRVKKKSEAEEFTEYHKKMMARLENLKSKSSPAIKGVCTKKAGKLIALLKEQDVLTKRIGKMEQDIMTLVNKIGSGACE